MYFTYDNYRHLIELLKSQNYQVCNYSDYHNFDRPLIIRHDVDYSLQKAIRIAEIENELNVKSTFFVLLSSDFYNVFSKENYNLIKKIISYGHNIGLHFDETRYEYKRTTFHDCVVNEAIILSSAIDYNINSVSMHRPSKNTLAANYRFEGLINSYGNEFFNDFKYLSDSRMFWRENIEKIIESNSYDKLHILTHPFWYNIFENSLKEIVDQFCKSASTERYDQLSQNFKNLSEVIKREVYLNK